MPDDLHPLWEQIEVPPAALAETLSFAHQCSIAEEGRFDREHIEPGHVAGRIAAFEHDVLYREFGHVPELHATETAETTESIRTNDSKILCQRANECGALTEFQEISGLFSSRSTSENWRRPCGTQLTAALKPRKRASPYRAAISGLIVVAPIVARILLMERRTVSREAALAF
ncbi:hypothetical protein ACVWXO_000653 [Bradyrhizobium sp. LM2.7]